MTIQDPHSRITTRILVELENGSRPWLKPWSSGDMATSGRTRPLRTSGEAYRGINVLLLWIEAQASPARSFSPTMPITAPNIWPKCARAIRAICRCLLPRMSNYRCGSVVDVMTSSCTWARRRGPPP